MNKQPSVREILEQMNAPLSDDVPAHELEADTDLTSDGKPVPAGHETAAFVLGSKGRRIPLPLAKRLGLAGDEKAVHKADVEDKAVHHAQEKAAK